MAHVLGLAKPKATYLVCEWCEASIAEQCVGLIDGYTYHASRRVSADGLREFSCFENALDIAMVDHYEALLEEQRKQYWLSARHELTCKACRVSWYSWALRLLGVGGWVPLASDRLRRGSVPA